VQVISWTLRVLSILCGKIFTMTFQRSLYISICIHVLAFGSAVAFAQFARGALWGNREVITVSLLGPGAGSSGRLSMSREHGVVRSRADEARVDMPEKTSPPVPAEAAAPKQSVREDASLTAVKDDGKTGVDDAGDADVPPGRKGPGSTGAGPGTQFGLMSAEQWAVIESAIERSKSYPRMARERGIQGVVHVRFKLRPTGDVETVEIVKSSGYDILDTASVRTVYRAAPLPYVNGWVEVPMAYVLK
jgi:TonB family protein